MNYWKIVVFIVLFALLKYTITDHETERAIEFAHYMEIAKEEEAAYNEILKKLTVDVV